MLDLQTHFCPESMSIEFYRHQGQTDKDEALNEIRHWYSRLKEELCFESIWKIVNRKKTEKNEFRRSQNPAFEHLKSLPWWRIFNLPYMTADIVSDKSSKYHWYKFFGNLPKSNFRIRKIISRTIPTASPKVNVIFAVKPAFTWFYQFRVQIELSMSV